GPGAGTLTISGNSVSRVFLIGQSSQNLGLVVALSGLKIANGNVLNDTSKYGAGVLNFGSLTVTGCTFSGNVSSSSGGGAIYSRGALTVNNGTFTNNSAAGGNGGGIYNVSSST